MELEHVFTDQKWQIIKNICSQKLSPLQLSERTNTTMANISQQLRLLEATNIVKKEKVKNRDKGKPRTLYSLTQDYLYFISAADNFAKKRLIHLTDYHKKIVKIWLITDSLKHKSAAKLFFEIEESVDKIKAFIIKQEDNQFEFLISTQNSDIKNIIAKLNKNKEGIKISHINPDEALRYYTLSKH